jgi:hypothetical protein
MAAAICGGAAGGNGAHGRVTFLLGDPTLRRTYVAQPAAHTAAKINVNGNTVIQLTWAKQPAATAGYRVYHASSLVPSVWTFVEDVDQPAGASVIWNHNNAATGDHAYLVKSLAVASGGFGSFTNSSLGTVSMNMTTLP